MSIKTFAAIDIGSYELAMKIFQFSVKGGMKEIDSVRYSIDLGTEAYANGKISCESVNEICRVLQEFTDIMNTYKVSDYKAYGTSAIREIFNTAIVLDQIRQRTGITIEVLNNSEQRFLDYKSIASKGEGFNKIIEKGTAIVDIGGGSIQLSLFDNAKLVTTQNMKLGILRILERLNHIDVKPSKQEALIDEMVNAQMSVFKKLYLKDRKIENIIVVDDYLSIWLARQSYGKGETGYADVATYEKFMTWLRTKTFEEIGDMLDLREDSAPFLFIAAVLMKQMIKTMEAELIWAPGVTLCDGIAYEYAEKNKMILVEHDFEQDIIASARNISKRYMGSRRRGETLEKMALTIYDSMKKVHGLGKRERLLLQLSALLHDCGKYISLIKLGECSYNIIMSTEIIGLSHVEREIVANVVKYNHMEFMYFDEMQRTSTLDKEAYLMIAKLTAILKIANAMDRSHKQKFKNIKTVLKNHELLITVDTTEDITLEKGLFGSRAAFFEEVYSITPVIKQKRTF